MKESLIQRLRNWYCKKYGHIEGELWYYNGVHTTCKRCSVIYTPISNRAIRFGILNAIHNHMICFKNYTNGVILKESTPSDLMEECINSLKNERQ